MTAAAARREQTILAADLLQLTHGKHTHAGTGCAVGMADGDSTAVRIPLGHIDGLTRQAFHFLNHRQVLGSKSFVALKHVQIVDGQADLFQGLQVGIGGADTHDTGLHADIAAGDPAGDRLIAQFLGLLGGHHQEEGCTVITARGIACSCHTARQNTSQLAQALHCSLGAGELVLIHNDFWRLAGGSELDRDDLVAGDTLLVCLCQTHLAIERIFITLFAADAPLLGHAIADLDHIDIFFLRRSQTGGNGRGRNQLVGVSGHRKFCGQSTVGFHTANNHYICQPHGNLAGCMVHRSDGATALHFHICSRNLHGKSCLQGDIAGGATGCGVAQCTASKQAIYLTALQNTCSLNQPLYHLGSNIGAGHFLKYSTQITECRSATINKHDFSHNYQPHF